MNNTLASDFQAFINYRLDYVNSKVRLNPDYKAHQENVDIWEDKIRAALNPELAITLQDIYDSNMAMLDMHEQACYRQSFNDAIKLIAIS